MAYEYILISKIYIHKIIKLIYLSVLNTKLGSQVSLLYYFYEASPISFKIF